MNLKLLIVLLWSWASIAADAPSDIKKTQDDRLSPPFKRSVQLQTATGDFRRQFATASELQTLAAKQQIKIILGRDIATNTFVGTNLSFGEILNVYTKANPLWEDTDAVVISRNSILSRPDRYVPDALSKQQFATTKLNPGDIVILLGVQ